ncbi:MAG: hypothetical protein AAF556_05640, partial [Pseudomonadota bacterium]
MSAPVIGNLNSDLVIAAGGGNGTLDAGGDATVTDDNLDFDGGTLTITQGPGNPSSPSFGFDIGGLAGAGDVSSGFGDNIYGGANIY